MQEASIDRPESTSTAQGADFLQTLCDAIAQARARTCQQASIPGARPGVSKRCIWSPPTR
ncbi:hypothetical protein Micbo1qcDRAFT_37478 [Microdochium bolleyi]|uniref:Uncharacterized protein n=1 Tax=Microdochium bolleyi TaxID=196109 RepID=A0A136ILR8_9PEZI|nr:hypothetical protein Micbo1qcDRAFT_37478 [Microdochium bolleyi]